MAAGTVVFRGVDARDAIEHFAGAGSALAFKLFAADHVAGAGVFEHIGLRRVAEPVTHHAGSAQLNACRSCRGGCRLQAECPQAFSAGLQASAFKQGLQALFWIVGAFQALALNTAGGGGAERNQHPGFASELVESVFQR